MSVVPHWTSSLENRINEIQSSPGRDNLPVLNPGTGFLLEKTTNTWFRFLHDLSLAVPDILREGWVQEWPTYKFIPDHFKERWFLQLAERYTWEKTRNRTIYRYFNEVARTVFRHQVRMLRSYWAHGRQKPEWMLTSVWDEYVEMFIEIGPDNCGF